MTIMYKKKGGHKPPINQTINEKKRKEKKLSHTFKLISVNFFDLVDQFIRILFVFFCSEFSNLTVDLQI